MTFATFRTLAVAVTMLTLGWVAGRAQAPAPPDFELRINAPSGETRIECVRGCDLAWVERGNPDSRGRPEFWYSCTAPRCSSGRVGGWIRRSTTGIAQDASPIQGTWLPSTAELAGKPFPDDVRKTIKLAVEGGTYTVMVGTQVDTGTVTVNPAANPKELDITGTEGPNAGKTIHAIYEQERDTLRICYDLSGQGRPTEFKTPQSTQLFLVTYKREMR
jgi:uncharacterized protein (TIGR03067 family)